ncbi:hypothetical protein RG963_01655 [Methanosarcina sp. Z-7115]|uniref:Uncharacterized protein n=1 Tax=Methanosarcina baikalica TaxID=3073890 RepID=A0ABU2CXN7_9EURY|nr:hypothetical protein [Methanosarcina sp. Z-7115]MDR7664507.1 hypothetical protein [Methanosarcina sp. Z-7115]
MLKMKKILGILLAFCFVMSVTAAAVSAAPFDSKNVYNNHNDGNKKYDNHDGNKKYDNHDGNKKYDNHYGKKKYQMKGHWGYKKVKHNKDKHHKSFWYSNDRYWIPAYWYWK